MRRVDSAPSGILPVNTSAIQEEKGQAHPSGNFLNRPTSRYSCTETMSSLSSAFHSNPIVELLTAKRMSHSLPEMEHPNLV